MLWQNIYFSISTFGMICRLIFLIIVKPKATWTQNEQLEINLNSRNLNIDIICGQMFQTTSSDKIAQSFLRAYAWFVRSKQHNWAHFAVGWFVFNLLICLLIWCKAFAVFPFLIGFQPVVQYSSWKYPNNFPNIDIVLLYLTTQLFSTLS